MHFIAYLSIKGGYFTMSYQKDFLENSETGNLKISEDVIASITTIAAKEIEGVEELSVAPANIKGIFKNKSAASSVLVELGDGVAVIDVYLKIKYGAKVQSVSADLQKKVKDSVQNMTGIAVSKVNVHITSIAIEDKKKK